MGRSAHTTKGCQTKSDHSITLPEWEAVFGERAVVDQQAQTSDELAKLMGVGASTMRASILKKVAAGELEAVKKDNGTRLVKAYRPIKKAR